MRLWIILFSTLLSLSVFSPSNAIAANRTYLVNGIASAIPFIGYGMRNLKKKIRGAKLFSYLTSSEGKAVARNIVKDAAARYASDPGIKINLIGISYGANMVTQIASSLASKGIKVHYLGIIDGGKLTPLRSNVQKADNFTCTNSDCTGGKAYIAGGNTVTVLRSFSIKSSHIPLANNAQVHSRVVAQVR